MKKKFNSTRASARILRDVWSAEGDTFKERRIKEIKREREKGRKRREEKETIWTEWSESVLRDTLEGVDASLLSSTVSLEHFFSPDEKNILA